MASGRNGAGLTIGQLITLTFGFLLASVVIFVFGLWVGRDLAEQRLAQERQVIRLPVVPPTPLPTEIAAGVPAGSPAPVPTVALPARTGAPPGATSSPTAARTATGLGQMVPWGATPTRAVAEAARQTPGAGAWTVQVTATNDPVQAVVLARRLRAKGYDAYTVQGPVQGVTWYRVRVGRFHDKASAKAVEARLRRDEQLEAAFVTAEQ